MKRSECDTKASSNMDHDSRSASPVLFSPCRPDCPATPPSSRRPSATPDMLGLNQVEQMELLMAKMNQLAKLQHDSAER